MNQEQIAQRFERFLRSRSLKLTNQRRRLLERVFATHEHFSAETMYRWLAAEPGEAVSRATVYRTLSLLLEGGFVEALDAGRGELVYEHVMGHAHHDHMLCLACGRIEEFHDARIESLQLEACRKKGFELVAHDLRLRGYCRACQRQREGQGSERATAPASRRGAGGRRRAPSESQRPASARGKRDASS